MYFAKVSFSRKNEDIVRREKPVYVNIKNYLLNFLLENAADYGNMATEIQKVIIPKPSYDGHLHSRYEVDQCKSGFIKFKNGCQKFVGCEEILKAEATASVKIGNGRVKDHT